MIEDRGALQEGVQRAAQAKNDVLLSGGISSRPEDPLEGSTTQTVFVEAGASDGAGRLGSEVSGAAPTGADGEPLAGGGEEESGEPTTDTLPSPPAVTTTPATPLPPGSPSAATPIGISFAETLSTLSPQARAAMLDDALALGVTHARFDLNWNSIQGGGSASFDWSVFDQVVEAVLSRDIVPLVIIGYTPPWARPSGCATLTCAPADLSQFASFAGSAAARYGSLGVHHWEIWNEPNISAFWSPTPDPARYATLLSSTANTIRAADPGAVIISGGLAPAATAGANVSQLDFLREMCAQGAVAAVDAIGYHPYSFPAMPSNRVEWSAWSMITATTPSVRSIVDSCGGTGKSIWATEYGAPTEGAEAEAQNMNEDLQARMADESVRLARSSDAIGALFWFTSQDLSAQHGNPEISYGLRRRDGSAKPSWYALQQAIIETN